MDTPNNSEEIDDVEILKEKIIKINSIFTIIAEKEGKISALETKLKNATRSNIKLECRNNELLSDIESCQKEKEHKQLEYSGKLLEEAEKYTLLEEIIEKLKSTNQEAINDMIEQLKAAKQKHIQLRKKYKRCLIKKNQQYKNAKMKYTYQIYRLRKIIKYQRSGNQEVKTYPNVEEIGPVVELKQTQKIHILENILINPLQKNEEEEKIDIDALLNEMTSLPVLLSPFEEEIVPEKFSIQTQTIRSSVTRPVQTDSLSTAWKQTQTLVRTSIAQVQCELPLHYPENVMQPLNVKIKRESKSIQTEVKNHMKQTQTTKSSLMSASTQTYGLFVEKKITLKRAVAVLKRSRKTFTISNGKLMHYSMNPVVHDTSNESLITQSVYRRLVKYIDKHYAGMDSGRPRRISKLLCETKQLERSRDLMQLVRSGLTLTGHSDTESSGYESRILQPARHFEDLLKLGLSTPGDTGISSGGESGKQSPRSEEDINIEGILKEVIVDIPKPLSPMSQEQEVEVDVEPAADVELTEEFIEIEPEKKTRKRPLNRMAMLKRKIKKCSQVNILRTPVDIEKIEECLPSKKRQALGNLRETTKVDLDKLVVEAEPAQSDTENAMKFDVSNSDVGKLNIDKVNANEEFRRMRQKCISKNSNSNMQKTFEIPPHIAKPKLRGEDILALLNKSPDSDHSYAAPSALEYENMAILPNTKTQIHDGDLSANIELKDMLEAHTTLKETQDNVDYLGGLDIGANVNIYTEVKEQSKEITEVPVTDPMVVPVFPETTEMTNRRSNRTLLSLRSSPSPRVIYTNDQVTAAKNVNINMEVEREKSPESTEVPVTDPLVVPVVPETPERTNRRSSRTLPSLRPSPSPRVIYTNDQVIAAKNALSDSPESSETPVKEKRGRPRKNSVTTSPAAAEENLPAKRLCMSPTAEVLKTNEIECLKVVETNVLTTRSGRTFKRPVLRRQVLAASPKCKEAIDTTSTIETPIQRQYQESPVIENCDIKKRIARTPKHSIALPVKAAERGMPPVIDLNVDTCFKKDTDNTDNTEKLLPQGTSSSNGECLPEYKCVREQVIIPGVNVKQAISSVSSNCLVPKTIETMELAEINSKCEKSFDTEPKDDGDADESKREGVGNLSMVKAGKKMLFKRFKVHLDQFVWYRGDLRICKHEVEVFKSLNVNKLVNFTIHYIRQDQGNLDKPKTPTAMEPLLTVKQKVVIGLLVHIENDLQTNDYSTHMIKETEKHLLYNEQRDPEMLENLSRFYTALCRLQQKKHRVRVFLGDLLYINPTHKFVIIFTILTSWLNVLTPYSANTSGAGIDRVLAYIVMIQPNTAPESTAHSMHDNCIGVLKNLLVTYFKYPREEPCVNDLMTSLLESYMCGGHVQYEAAILILCCFGSPQWTYDKTQLIGELCKVSTDAEVVRNLIQLMTNIARRLKPEFQAKVNEYLDELTSHLQKTMDLDLKSVCER